MDPRLIGRDASATGLAVNLVGRTAAGMLVLFVLLAIIDPLLAAWGWTIAVPLASVVAWRINPRGLFITGATAMKATPVEPPSAMTVSSIIEVADATAGSWFCLDTEVQAVQLQAERSRALAVREQNFVRDRSETLAAEDLKWRRLFEFRQAEALKRPPKARDRAIRQLQTEETARRAATQSALRHPVSPRRRETELRLQPRLAVVITPTSDGRWRIWPHTGTPIVLASDELLYIGGEPHIPALDPIRRRITDQISTLVAFVADHEGRVRVPAAGSLPLDKPAKSDWECHQAIRLARRFGLLTASRRGVWRWFRDVGRALIGRETPLDQVPLDLALTATGREWLKAAGDPSASSPSHPDRNC